MRTLLVQANAVYHSNGTVEFMDNVEPPGEGARVLIQYEQRQPRDLSRHFGVLATDEAQQMLAAIEDGCEQIDAHAW